MRISSATMRNDGLLGFRWVGAVNGSSSALRVAEPRRMYYDILKYDKAEYIESPSVDSCIFGKLIR